MSAVDASTLVATGEAYCATCATSFGPEVTHCPHDGAKLIRLKPDHDGLIGRVLDGRYKILKPLGEGGMGTVYRASQMSVDREVALKVVHPSIASRSDAAKRFLREVRLASRLNAPNIVNVIDFGQSDDGLLFLVMELVKGDTLAAMLASSRVLSPAKVIGIATQLCDALITAHAAGIVHRDLKPGNVIVCHELGGHELVKVLDFGLAKMIEGDSGSGITTGAGILGTPAYMAPEMIEGGTIDARTDLYALGCVLYELLAGTVPFTDQTITAIFANHLQGEVPPLPAGVPPELAMIVMRLLAKSPDARFQTAGELRDALATIARRASTPAIVTPAPPPARRGWLIAIVALFVAGIAAAAVVLTTSHDVVLAPLPPGQPSINPPAPVDAMIDAMIAIDAEATVIVTPLADAGVRHHAPQVPKPKPKPPADELPFVPTP